MKKILSIVLFFVSASAWAQNTYTVELSSGQPSVLSNHLKLGSNRSPSGAVLDANSLYFIKNGKPWYPVMGEFHFSRYPKVKWEESILKMKAAGIDVIASYVFWIYHEEEEGTFNWSGNNDLRAFVSLCKKHDMYFFARIGPWAHGEVRNGGFPDWIVKRGNMRKSNPEYLSSVQKFYDQIGKQLQGHYFKDGGAVIGAQIENEFRFNNPTGLEHILSLKKMAVASGIDVPFYTATGWPGSNQKQTELIPVWGAYPEAPWDKRTTKLPFSENYLFSTLRNDPAIGSDLLGKHEEVTNYKGYLYPYATAEMGGGNQITYHRRPIITSDDVTALAYAKVGAGANLMGYYMFHGGSNPIGKLSTLQESKATKYPNDYPIISYDFLSPIGEWGQLRPSYRAFKTLHTFLNEFGTHLVQYYPAFPAQKPVNASDNKVLRFAVRSKDSTGFVFVSNYQRQLEMKDFDQVKFNLKFGSNDSLSFPAGALSIKKNVQAVFPFNMDLDGLTLKYATAQPFCRVEAEVPLYVFFAPQGVNPEFAFVKELIKDVQGDGLLAEKGNVLYNRPSPGINSLAQITLVSGKKIKILTLTNEQVQNSWKVQLAGKEYFFISNQNIEANNDGVTLTGEGNNEFKLLAYPALTQWNLGGMKAATTEGIFASYTMILPANVWKASFKEIDNIAAFKRKGKLIPADNRDSIKNTEASPGPRYQTTLSDVKGAKYYEIKIPSVSKLDNAYLKLKYTGDTGSAYMDGTLIADDFYSGLPMTIGLKHLPESKAKNIVFQIVPLTDEQKIYFEDNVREPLVGKNVASLSGVEVIPQFKIILKAK